MIDQPNPRPALTVQFFLRHGTIVKWPVPGDPTAFNLGVLIQSIRAQGYFLQADFYLPADEIACIGLQGADAAPSVRVVRPAVQPEHRTKQ